MAAKDPGRLRRADLRAGTDGAVSAFVDNFERNNPYPFSVSDAANLLKAHGWANVGSGKVAYCAKPGSGPGECGAGVPKGLQLKFNLDYQSGSVVTAEEMVDLKSQASQAGIDLELTTSPFAPGHRQGHQLRPARDSHAHLGQVQLDGSQLGSGLDLRPRLRAHRRDAVLHRCRRLTTRATATPTADKLIQATTDGPDSQTIPNMDAYENYLAKTLPVVFFPTATGDPTSAAIDLISKHLGGFINNVYTNMTPETWYLTK